jgi:hypothetical protein
MRRLRLRKSDRDKADQATEHGNAYGQGACSSGKPVLGYISPGDSAARKRRLREMSGTLDRDIVDQPGGSDPAADSLARARHMAVMEGSHGWREGIATPLDAAGGPKEARALPPG